MSDEIKNLSDLKASKKPKSGGSNFKIGGIIVALILGGLYLGTGGKIDVGGETAENEEQVTPQDDKEKKPEYFGLVDYLPTSTTGNIIKHTHYSLSYSEKHKQAEWVAYEITRDMVLNTTAERGHLSFKADPNLDKKKALVSKDYTRTGYDRGHLLPAQDMAFDKEAMKETFFMTNVSPQQKDFNRGVWKSLELLVRDWAANFDKIYVITGPVLTKRAKSRFPKAKKSVPVPSSYYKIILDYTGTDIKAIGFWLKNEESDNPLVSFATTIDDIEELTGIDFFSKLPDDIEDKLESEVELSEWALTKDAYSATLDEEADEKLVKKGEDRWVLPQGSTSIKAGEKKIGGDD